MEKTIEGHLERIKISLAAGRATLRAMQGTVVTTYDVPDAVPDNSIVYLSRPEETDKYVPTSSQRRSVLITCLCLCAYVPRFYLATDERDRGKMAYLTAHGAVLIDHLLTRDDRREFGWELMLTDVLGLVEQAVLARASYFYAHAMSSYAGGTINMRGACARARAQSWI